MPLPTLAPPPRRDNPGFDQWVTSLYQRLTALQASIDDENGRSVLTPAQVTDLTDGGDSSLHYHDADRARANHTGTQLASTISDLDAFVRSIAANSDHAGLTNLSWLVSGHTATATTIAGFNSSGQAELLTRTGTGTVAVMQTSPTIAGTPVFTSANVTWSGNPTHSGDHTFSSLISALNLVVSNLSLLTNLEVSGSTTLGDTAGDTATLNAGVWDATAQGGRFKFRLGDAIRANRTMFMSRGTDEGSNVGVIPNGTSKVAAWTAFSSSDPDNSHFINIVTGATSTAISTGKAGTGTQRDLELQISGATKAKINTDGVLQSSGLVATLLTAPFSMTIPADHGVIVPDRYEIPAGIVIELADGAIMEVT